MKRAKFFLIFLLSSILLLSAEDDINNHLVDLDLPSGILWLDHNLGASNCFDFGEYYLGSEDNYVESELGTGFSVPTRAQFQELIDNTTQCWGYQSGIKGLFFNASNGKSIFLPAAAQLCYDDKEGEGFWNINNAGSGAYWTCTPSEYSNYIYFLEFCTDENRAFFGDREKTTNRLTVRPVYRNPFSCTVYEATESRHIGENAKGFCADGISKLKITYKSKDANLDSFADIKFYMSNEIIEDSISGSIKKIEYYADSINIILEAPVDYLANGNFYDVELVITPSSIGENLTPERFKYSVYRPGVLLFHGLGDNCSLFDLMIDTFVNEGNYTLEQLLAVDYSSSNTSSFYENTHVNHIVRKGCYQLQDAIFEKIGIICSRFDMIGHSMGGILIRLFVQEDGGKSYINKILTLNTPHYGSELGNIAVWAEILNASIQNKLIPNDSENNYTFIHNLLTEWLFKNDNSLEALKDLSISSDAISNLNGPSSDLIRGIPIHTVCSTIPNMSIGSFPKVSPFIFPQLLLGVIKCTIDNIIGDGVVPLYSQQGGLIQHSSVLSGDIINAFHCNSPKWDNYISKVISLLNAPRNSNYFDFEGINASGYNKIQQYSTHEVNTDYLEVLSPIDNNMSSLALKCDVLSVKERMINLIIDKTDDINYLFVIGLTDNNNLLYSINSTEHNFDLSNIEFDKITFYVVGKTDYNAILIDSLSIDKDFNISSTNSIEEYSNDFILITNGNNIIVHSKEQSNFDISLFNITGQIISDREKCNEAIFQCLENGLYFINISVNGKQYTYKICL